MKKEIKSTFEQEEQTGSAEYSPEEVAYRSYLIKRAENARDLREEEFKEFDDLSYSAWYDSNARAANSYNPPKENKEDTRIVTGTTLEKENTLLSALLNYNLEPNVSAFDKENIELMEVGEVMEDMVLKSRKMENYDEKRPLYYKELLDQGTCFIEEVKTEQIVVEKKFQNNRCSCLELEKK